MKFLFLILSLFLGVKAQLLDSIKKDQPRVDFAVFATLGFEYIDNSYFSTVSTQDNIWNQEIKKQSEVEIDLKFKINKKIKWKAEFEFDRNDPQIQMKDLWLTLKPGKKQKLRLGYAKNQLGLRHNTPKKGRLSLTKTLGHDFLKTSQTLERDFGLEYAKSFRTKGKGFGFSLRSSADDAKNFYQNTSWNYKGKNIYLKLDYVGLLTKRKEYDLNFYNQIAALSGEYFTGSILKKVPRYKVVSEIFAGDNIKENFRNSILDAEKKEYFAFVEQRHAIAFKHNYSFLKSSQYIWGASVLNPHKGEHFESISGINLYLVEGGLLVWKSEFLWRFLSQKGFTLTSALQFFW